jgi:hypothetical protein
MFSTNTLAYFDDEEKTFHSIVMSPAHSDDCPYGRIHPLRVAAAGEDGNGPTLYPIYVPFLIVVDAPVK